MNCPLCATVALEARFSHGIEVDVCPNCKGIWLDRGELERLLDSAEPARSPAPPPPSGATSPRVGPQTLADSAPAPAGSSWEPGPSDHRSASRDQRGDKKKKKKKKKGWADRLEDVLDDVLDF